VPGHFPDIYPMYCRKVWCTITLMDSAAAAIQLGLRVLAAINANTNPDPADVAMLRLLAPHLADYPIDELACMIVQQGLRERCKTAGQH
jgi:hypothetical protein